MDVSQLIQQMLIQFGLDQRDLADAAGVTESYIDIYDKLGRVLKLPASKFDGLADLQHYRELQNLRDLHFRRK